MFRQNNIVKSLFQSKQIWRLKIRSLTQWAAVFAVLSSSSAHAADFDVNNGNAGTTYNGATTAITGGTTPANVYITQDITLGATATATMNPATGSTVLFQGSDAMHNRVARSITDTNSNVILNFGMSANRTTNLTITDLTLNSVMGTPGLRLAGAGFSSVINLTSDATFHGNILLQSSRVNISSGDGLGDAANVVTASSAVLGITQSVTIPQDFVLANPLFVVVANGLTAEMSGDISGIDNLHVGDAPQFASTGTLILSGANNYTGTTTIGHATAGSPTVRVNGTLDSDVTINATGTLGGSGFMFGTISNSGTVDPGAAANAIGTLTVGNTFTANSGSTLHIDVLSATNDVFAIDTAVLNGNGTVFIHSLGGTVLPNRQYTFLTTNNATLGGANVFAGVADDLPLVNFVLGYTANSAYFYAVSSGTGFASVALTPNELAVATYLDQTAGTASGDYQTVIDQLSFLDVDQLRSAYNQMSGESHGTAGQFAINTTTLWIQHVANHLSSAAMFGSGGSGGPTTNLMAQVSPTSSAAASPNNVQQVSHTEASIPDEKAAASCALCCNSCENEKLWNGWSAGYGLGGSAQSDGNASGASYGVGGFLAGVDRWVDESTLVGVFGGYLGSGFSTTTPSANVHDNAGQGGLYALRRGDIFYASGVIGGQSDQYTSRRNINFGTINRTATGNYDGWQGFGYSELGANLAARNLTLQPYGALQYIHLRQNSISETGAGSLNLFSGGMDTDSLRSFLGTRLRYDHHGENNLRRFVPELQASWLHEYIDSSTALNARFGAVGGNGFTTTGLNVGRDWALLGAGMTYVVTDNIRLTANYYAQTNDRQTYHVGAGGLNVQW